MRFGSLFAGIGGFDLALERAGMECVWQVEIDDACRRVLARHWPDMPRYRDVQHVHDQRGTRCPNCLPTVDVLVGGFPCQDVSVAGRRAGLAGERSGLWFDFHRLAAQLRPRWLVIENVPGLLNSWSPTEAPPSGLRAGQRWEVEESDDFESIVAALVELGYGVAWRVLDAQYFDVAQRRERVFVVGCLGDPARAAQVLLEPESCSGHPPPRRRPPEDAAGSLGSQPAGGGWQSDTDRMMFVADTLLGGPTGKRGPGHGARSGDGKDRLLVSAPPLGHHRRIDLESETFVAAPLTDDPHSDRPAEEANLIAHSLRASGADGSEDGTGRGTPLVVVADTLNASYANSTDHAGGTLARQGMTVRRLTPTECERLQGFPDGWTAGESDSARYRMLGNAVCVPVVEWIGRRLVGSRGDVK